jgi:betaine lipid synthase
MAQYVDVPKFFTSVYLVDFSPSLCEVARKRFARLGWNNVKVVCQDARKFRLEDHEPPHDGAQMPGSPHIGYFSQNRPEHGGVDLITMSYSLSMIVCTAQNPTGFLFMLTAFSRTITQSSMLFHHS